MSQRTLESKLGRAADEGRELRLDSSVTGVGESMLAAWQRRWALNRLQICDHIAGIEACLDEVTEAATPALPLQVFRRI